jgi:Rrf2 family protein
VKLITRDTDYALRAICAIAQNKGKIITVVDLAKKLKVPQPFLRKILQFMNKKKILRSLKGQGGGFLLALPAEKIFLIELMRMFQGKLKLNECFLRKKECPNIRVLKIMSSEN